LKEDVSAMATSVPTAENNYIKQDWLRSTSQIITPQ
jgi:hypothetical protein